LARIVALRNACQFFSGLENLFAKINLDLYGAEPYIQIMKTTKEFPVGSKVTVGKAYRMGGAYVADGWEGVWFVVGHCGLYDVQIARHPADDYEGIVHLSRVIEAGHHALERSV
jgi:hypothetical protein